MDFTRRQDTCFILDFGDYRVKHNRRWDTRQLFRYYGQTYFIELIIKSPSYINPESYNNNIIFYSRFLHRYCNSFEFAIRRRCDEEIQLEWNCHVAETQKSAESVETFPCSGPNKDFV